MEMVSASPEFVVVVVVVERRMEDKAADRGQLAVTMFSPQSGQLEVTLHFSIIEQLRGKACQAVCVGSGRIRVIPTAGCILNLVVHR